MRTSGTWRIMWRVFLDNINTMLEMAKSNVTFNTKKYFKINGKKCGFGDRNPFLEYLQNAYKIMALPEKLSFTIILSSACDIIDLLYTSFLDEVHFSQECFGLIEEIDRVITGCFTRYVFMEFFKVSLIGFEEEFEILDQLVVSPRTENREENGGGKKTVGKIESLVNRFE